MIRGGGLTPILRFLSKSGPDPVESRPFIASRLERMACRSTRATVGRIMIGGRNALRRSVRQVLEAGVLLDERELGGADRTVSLLADDDLGRPLLLGVRIAIGV